jgi:hypothetical protein
MKEESKDCVYLMMSSGNFDGINLAELAGKTFVE